MTLKEKQVAVITLNDLLSDLANQFGHPSEDVKTVIGIIQLKIQQTQAAKCSSTKDWIKTSGDKLIEILTLLSEGKKVKVTDKWFLYDTNTSRKIEYVYANPQMNRLFAVLEDGAEEDYDWSVLDIYSSYGGEYIKPVTIKLEFISYTDGIGKQVQGKEIQVSAEWDDQKVADYILHNEHEHLDKDLMIVFPGGYTMMLQSAARDRALTEDHLSHIGG